MNLELFEPEYQLIMTGKWYPWRALKGKINQSLAEREREREGGGGVYHVPHEVLGRV